MIRIVVNGQERHIPDGHTLRDLLAHLELSATPCAVEVNRAVVPKRRHAEHRVREGDQIEIVTLVGGG